MPEGHADKHLEIGLEPTLREHIETLVEVFRELRRVVKPQAAVWLNYGDCYATSPNGRSAADTKAAGNDDRTFRDKPFSTIGPIFDPSHSSKRGENNRGKAEYQYGNDPGRIVAGSYLKPKDLCLIPFRLVQALQAPEHMGPIKHEIDRAWLAGIVDADGCIGIRREDNSKKGWQASFIPYLTVGCSDESMLRRCVEITGLGKVNLKAKAGSSDARGITSRRDHFSWRLDGQIASQVIRDLYPYLMVKACQARVCYALNLSQSSFGPGRFKAVPADKIAYRQALYEGIKALNQRQTACLPEMPEVEPNYGPGWWVRSRCVWGKPNGMPDSSGRWRPSVAHEEIFLLNKGGGKGRLVKFSDLVGKPLHLCQSLGLQDADFRAHQIASLLATAILNGTQSQEKVGAISLDSQIRQKCAAYLGSKNVAGGPEPHRTSGDELVSIRQSHNCLTSLNPNASAKDFLCEINRMGLRLADGHMFLIGGIDTPYALPPSINVYGERTIAIHNAGEVCKFDFAHGWIIIETPSHSNMFYDSEAVKSPAAKSQDGRVRDDAIGGSSWQERGQHSKGGRYKTDKQRGHSRRHQGFNDRWDGMSKAEQQENGRLLRTYEPEVWHIATAAFSEAHFATFPPALVERCLMASCPPGGTVLDPFGGSGTTGIVADGMGFDAILIELSEAYAEIARSRIADMFRPVWIERKTTEQTSLFAPTPECFQSEKERAASRIAAKRAAFAATEAAE